MMWILSACRSGARIFQRKNLSADIELVDRIEHPEGRLHDRDVNSDAPGRAFDRAGVGRHSYSREESPNDRIASNFARALAERIGKARMEGKFDELALVVEPHFLGLVRDALDAPTNKLVGVTLAKDLEHVPPQELDAHLREALVG